MLRKIIILGVDILALFRTYIKSESMIRCINPKLINF
jgi:hypothetical protein